MQLDLNLLTAFDALLEEGSVGGAADRLHLSAPAMSRTLARIRVVTGDQILVRTGRTMTPTPYALQMRERVHALVTEAQSVLTPERELVLDTLVRTFTLQAHDAIASALGPSLLATVRALAPGVRLRLLSEGAVDTLDLRHGTVDLELGSSPSTVPEIREQPVGEDELVLAMRADHPLAGVRVTERRYLAADHVTTSRRGRLRDRVDDLLAERGLQRRVVASAATTTTTLHLVARSDLITLVPRGMCRRWLTALGLHTAPPPFALPPSPIIATWHERYDNDRAHRWLREQVAATVARGLAETP
jgi:DNA-binding transcriptional LysR family regulator